MDDPWLTLMTAPAIHIIDGNISAGSLYGEPVVTHRGEQQ